MSKLLFLIALYSLLPFYGQTGVDPLKRLVLSADSLSNERKYKEALDLYLEAEQIANAGPDSIILNSIYYRAGLQHIELGNDSEAIEFLKKSEQMSLVMKNDSCYSLALHGLGLSHSMRMEYDKAIDYYEKALEIQQKKVKDSRTEAVILNGLAGVYIASNDFGKTLTFSQKALAKIKETEDYDLHANILNTISICLEAQENYREALNYKKEALTLCKKNKLGIPLVLLANMGSNFHKLHEIDSALAYYKMAKEKAIQTEHDYGLARVNYRLGRLFRERRALDTSLSHFLKSYRYFQKSQDEQMLKAVSIDISEVYADLDRPAKALDFLKEHVKWKDSLQKRSAQKKLEEFEIKYETAEKERQIALLDKANILKASKVELQEKQKKTLWIVFSLLMALTGIGVLIWQRLYRKMTLERQNQLRYQSILEAEQNERKRIAQDLHDGLGQSIAVLKMQANSLCVETEEERLKREKLLLQLDLVYDELHDMAHNIMPSSLIKLGLVPAIRELVSKINGNGSLRVQMENQGDFRNLDENQAINLYRIVQEALVNIIKHARASLVNIKLFNCEGFTSLHIKDNGIGMNTDEVEGLEGMGWKNIISRVALLSGKIDVFSPSNRGTSIVVRLKTPRLASD